MIYVFNTWAVANLLHILVMLAFFGTTNGEFFHETVVSFYFTGTVYSFIFSVPALLMAWIVFYFVKQANVPDTAKFTIWIFLCAGTPVLIWLFFIYVFNGGLFYEEEFKLMLPSSIAALWAVLMRSKQFFKLFNQPKTDDHENKLV